MLPFGRRTRADPGQETLDMDPPYPVDGEVGAKEPDESRELVTIGTGGVGADLSPGAPTSYPLIGRGTDSPPREDVIDPAEYHLER